MTEPKPQVLTLDSYKKLIHSWQRHLRAVLEETAAADAVAAPEASRRLMAELLRWMRDEYNVDAQRLARDAYQHSELFYAWGGDVSVISPDGEVHL